MTLRRKAVKSRSRVERPPLGRERVIGAAVALADRGGIEAASMRRLAESLGVEAMSLYHHVADKEEVLDGMVDVVFGEVPLPSSTPDWREALRDRAIAMREALRRHPWALGLMESRARPGVATLQHHDWVLGTLRAAGFPVAGAAHAYSVLDAYVYGFALQELNLPLRDEKDVGEMAESFLRALPADRFPHLAEMARDHVAKPGYSYGAEFELGLDLILHGLERFRGAGGPRDSNR